MEPSKAGSFGYDNPFLHPLEDVEEKKIGEKKIEEESKPNEGQIAEQARDQFPSNLNVQNMHALREVHNKRKLEKMLGSKDKGKEEVKKLRREAITDDLTHSDLNFIYQAIRDVFKTNRIERAEKYISDIQSQIEKNHIKTKEQLASYILSNSISPRFQEPDAVSNDEILSMHALLFEGPLQSISEKKIIERQDPSSPQIPYIIKSLFDSIQAIQKYHSIENAIEAVNQHLIKKPQAEKYSPALPTIISHPRVLSQLERMEGGQEVLNIYNQYQADMKMWATQLKSFPIVLTQHLFNANNTHEVYALGDGSGKCLWIFKPVIKGDMPSTNDVVIAQRECTVSLLNEQFPIPKTIFVEINGWVGSAQFFIDEAKGIEQIDPNSIALINLQALVIADLLFGNMDSHPHNILFQEREGVSFPFGIDHDDCLQGVAKKELKLEYRYLSPIKKILDPSLMSLISKECLENYKKIMQNQRSPQESIDWLYTAARILNEAIKGQKTTDEAIEMVMQTWRQQWKQLS